MYTVYANYIGPSVMTDANCEGFPICDDRITKNDRWVIKIIGIHWCLSNDQGAYCFCPVCLSVCCQLLCNIRGILLLHWWCPFKWHQGEWSCNLDCDLCAKNSFLGLCCHRGHTVLQTHLVSLENWLQSSYNCKRLLAIAIYWIINSY